MTARRQPGQGQLQIAPTTPGAINPTAGETAKTRGMGLAQANTAPTWAAQCQAAIRTMALRGEPFQAADMVAEGLVDEPASPAQWGPQFGIAARAGVIAHHDYAPSKRATVHRSICKTWMGAGHYRAGGAA